MVDLIVAWDKLAQFQSADELARFFIGEGIKADVRNPYACAISVWLNGATGAKILTNTEAIAQLVLDVDNDVVSEQFASHTPAMAEFVAKFDAGCYPALVDSNYSRPSIYCTYT